MSSSLKPFSSAPPAPFLSPDLTRRSTTRQLAPVSQDSLSSEDALQNALKRFVDPAKTLWDFTNPTAPDQKAQNDANSAIISSTIDTTKFMSIMSTYLQKASIGKLVNLLAFSDILDKHSKPSLSALMWASPSLFSPSCAVLKAYEKNDSTPMHVKRKALETLLNRSQRTDGLSNFRRAIVYEIMNQEGFRQNKLPSLTPNACPHQSPSRGMFRFPSPSHAPTIQVTPLSSPPLSPVWPPSPLFVGTDETDSPHPHFEICQPLLSKIIQHKQLASTIGVFRKSGNKPRIDYLIESFSSTHSLPENLLHDLIGALKKLTQDDGIISTPVASRLTQLQKDSQSKPLECHDIREALGYIICPTRRVLLKQFIHILSIVASHHETNQMTASNLGISCIGILFSSRLHEHNQLKDMADKKNIAVFLIENFNELFFDWEDSVPS